MKVNKTQAILYIFETLLKNRSIDRYSVINTINMNEVTFRRYIQELRAYLTNFDRPYDLVYVKSEDKYYLKTL